VESQSGIFDTNSINAHVCKRKKKKGKKGASSSHDEKVISEDNVFISQHSVTKLEDSKLPKASETKRVSFNSTSTNPLHKKPYQQLQLNPHYRFNSSKDPEVDEETRLKYKFGKGTNLVAIGPPKVRDCNWMLGGGDAEAVTGVTEDAVALHSSPFTFGFEVFKT
jgi:hypothetical protein